MVDPGLQVPGGLRAWRVELRFAEDPLDVLLGDDAWDGCHFRSVFFVDELLDDVPCPADLYSMIVRNCSPGFGVELTG